MTLMAVSHNCKLPLYPHTPEEGEPKGGISSVTQKLPL